jgi:hypothetical protein
MKVLVLNGAAVGLVIENGDGISLATPWKVACNFIY